MSGYVHACEVEIVLHVRDDENTNPETAPCKHIPLRAVFTTPEEMYESLRRLMVEMDPVMGRGNGNGQ